MSRFFIERPIFATVVAIVMMIAGGVTVITLPIAQYPEITPPTVEVTTSYPGANPLVLAETVAAPIEQEVNGVEDMIYMSSSCTADGNYILTVSFEVGTDLDMASILVQNRVSIALPKLPDEVKRQGVVTQKKSTAIVLMINLFSPENRYDEVYLSNFATLRLTDELARIQGVGDVKPFGGTDYSMRVWLDPQLLRARNLTPKEVIDAISEQNVQVAAGQVGQPPVPAGQDFQYTVNTLGRLVDMEQFENIVVKVEEGGRLLRVKDIGRVELGAQNYDVLGRLGEQVSVALAIYQLPGANALEVANRVAATMERLSADFPEDLEYDIPFNTTIFVRQSIAEVFNTLWQASLLVILIIFIFLQDWRASLVPAITIPVSLIATFAVMGALGFSINLTTLFGLVLAIGIVVDDAIVVVENTARHIEAGLRGRQAAIKAMQEVTGAVIATTLVLLAVFVPTAFLPGITGQLYRQFGLTISAATVFSSINALTLSPALCAILLRPAPEKKNAFFRAFNAVFDRSEKIYGRIVALFVRKTLITLILFAGILFLAGRGFTALPSSFLPTEDQGYILSGIQLPNAASQERTMKAVEKVQKILRDTPGVKTWITLGGFSLIDASNSSNSATFYVVLDDFEHRTTPETSMPAIVAHLRRELYSVTDGIGFALPPPPITGLGAAGGFQLELQDRRALGLVTLQKTAMELVRDGNAQAGLVGLNSTFRADVPQIYLDVDRTKAKTLNVSLNQLFGTIQAYMGSAYVNDFNRFGRTYQVRVQAEPKFRADEGDLRSLYTRNLDGQMVPVGTLAKTDRVLGSQLLRRYNLYPSAAITGQAAPGFSSGDALTLMEKMCAEKLPVGMGYEWTNISYQEKKVGNQAILVFALAILLVFLTLAAQYESWTAPASIVLAVPFALLGVVVALFARGFPNDVYAQIGIVLLIGLASKTAILIVEFARDLRRQGKPIAEAGIEAARLRFRPVLMTAISFVFGTLPLLVASGAGAASRQAVGTAVFGGMIMATVLTVILVPGFFRVFQGIGEKLFKEGQHQSEGAARADAAAGSASE